VKNVYTDLLLHTRALKTGDEYGDKYIAESFSFTLNNECVYAFGQLATEKLDKSVYIDYLKTLKEKGFTRMIYESQGKPRPDLGGEQLGYMKSGEFFPIHNLWVKEV